MEYFEFHIVDIYETRAGVVNAEVELQWYANVLHTEYAPEQRAYWNGNIGAIKFISKEKVEHYARDFIRQTFTEHFTMGMEKEKPTQG
jgi:hypothetical protein